MSRSRCEACLRLEKLCLCDAVVSVDNVVEVLFLQHPLETLQVKNTARLAYLSLQNAQWLVGESFAEEDLLKRLAHKSWVLLYPETAEDRAPLVSVEQLSKTLALHNLGLVVLDGTWRKTRKMLFMNPFLAQLPRLQICMTQKSEYDIRKQKNASTYSTLEAVQQALSDLENNSGKYQHMKNGLQALLSQQKAFSQTGETY